ncbi:MAG: glycosyl transferase, partial [Cyclobacteriaceae bacterium]|nr:glycosyl transferase [Cyclobacteriaceae bacterium]
YWPPSGGSGVQRWLKFVKYLPQFGIEPIIFTPENPSFINKDESLLSEVRDSVEVIRFPIWEPYNLFSKVKGSKKAHQKEVNIQGKKSLFEKIALWIRGNLFLPDPRLFWIKPSVSFLKDFIPDNEIKLIITTGPPHSIHLIGKRLRKKLKIKWFADFRDPWKDWDLLDEFYPTFFSKWYHKQKESQVLNTCDQAITIGWEMQKMFEESTDKKVHVITNGFDQDDFEINSTVKVPGKSPIMIRHIGSVDDLRDPMPFLFTLKNYLKDYEAVSVEFIGNVSGNLIRKVQEDSVLKNLVIFREYVPFSELKKIYDSTDVLLLILAQNKSSKLNVTGKIFEYIASGCPVLAIGDVSGDAAKIINNTKCGVICDWKDTQFMEEQIDKIIQGKFTFTVNSETVNSLTRKNLTKKLSELIANELKSEI